MRIVIVGPGALGSLLAASLGAYAAKGPEAGGDSELPEIILLDYKQERAAQLNSSGLILEEKGQRVQVDIRVESEPAVCKGCHVLFLCVKAMAVEDSLGRIVPHLDRNTLFLAMQNGIGHLPAVASLNCLGGVGITSQGATLVAPGHVRHGGKGMTRIGLLGTLSEKGKEKLAASADLLEKAGWETVVTTDPVKHSWAKLFINVAINALTAIHRCPNGELLNSPERKATMAEAVREAVAVARALHIPVESDPVQAAFRVCELTRDNISSMHQDVAKQRKTEIEAINGAVVAHGGKLGIPTPVNEELVRRVREIEASYPE